MRQVFNTSVGTIEVLVDRDSDTVSVYRFDAEHIVFGKFEVGAGVLVGFRMLKSERPSRPSGEGTKRRRSIARISRMVS